MDSKIQRENNPKFIDNYVGSYSFFNDGSILYKKLCIKVYNMMVKNFQLKHSNSIKMKQLK